MPTWPHRRLSLNTKAKFTKEQLQKFAEIGTDTASRDLNPQIPTGGLKGPGKITVGHKPITGKARGFKVGLGIKKSMFSKMIARRNNQTA